MIALLLLALEGCALKAVVYKTVRSEPAALIRVDYMNEDCGTERPTIKSKTATILQREVYEGEAPECWEVPEPRTGPEEPCVNGCPCLSFMAWVRGLPGRHIVHVWSDGEGYVELPVQLLRGAPDVERNKLAAQ
jgi:hypothetical protein